MISYYPWFCCKMGKRLGLIFPFGCFANNLTLAQRAHQLPLLPSTKLLRPQCSRLSPTWAHTSSCPREGGFFSEGQRSALSLGKGGTASWITSSQIITSSPTSWPALYSPVTLDLPDWFLISPLNIHILIQHFSLEFHIFKKILLWFSWNFQFNIWLHYIRSFIALLEDWGREL